MSLLESSRHSPSAVSYTHLDVYKRQIVQDAVSQGIKVVSVDRVVNGVDVDCAIASDNVAGAQMATEYLVSLVGEGAKVAELEGVNGASATIDRGEGFHLVADEQLDVCLLYTSRCV